ncbi:MAG: hypothetical protein ACXVNM_09220 [Bacteroidia bacterium]
MKNLVKRLTVLNYLVMIFFISCTYEKIENEIPSVNTISLNKKYRINLPEEHLSGYIWQLNDNYDKKLIDNINTVWHGSTKGVDFNFKTLATGSTTLTFILRKYNDTSSIKHFVVQIKQ